MKCFITAENELCVILPINVRPSSSGKSMLVASTGGFQRTEATISLNGVSHGVKVSVNANIDAIAPQVAAAAASVTPGKASNLIPKPA